MTEPELVDRVKRVLVDEFELEEPDLHAQANLYEDLGLDSLDSVDLVVALEKEFDFKVVRAVDEEKIRAIRTVDDICGFIVQKMKPVAVRPEQA
jgi:acyl carrier protein